MAYTNISKYVNLSGLTAFWNQAKSWIEGQIKTVDDKVLALDTRVDTLEDKVKDSVVNTFSASNSSAAETKYITVGVDNASGDVALSVDDSALANKITGIEEAIEDVKAAAGVTKLISGTTAEDLVQLTISGEGKGDVTVGVNVENLNTELGDINNDIIALGTSIDGVSGRVTTLEDNLKDGFVKSLTGATAGNYITVGVDDASGDVALTLDETKLAAKITSIDEKIASLASATDFVGVTTTPLANESTTTTITVGGTEYQAVSGDIAIYNNDEFVFDGTKWYLLGNADSRISSIESNITAIDTWINAITAATNAECEAIVNGANV